jgi:hypothetical protein
VSRSVTEAFDFRTETGSHFCRKDNNIRPGLTVGLVAVGVCLAVVSGAAGAADADAPTVAVAEPTDGESGVALHQQTPVYRGKTLAMNILIRENTTSARRVLTREAAVD